MLRGTPTMTRTHLRPMRKLRSSASSFYYGSYGVCIQTNAVDEWWQERRRSGEEGYIGQIRRSRKHRQRGLTRSQKLLSSPIDFFSNITPRTNNMCQRHTAIILSLQVYDSNIWVLFHIDAYINSQYEL